MERSSGFGNEYPIPKNVEVVPSGERQKALGIWRNLENRLHNPSATNSADWMEVWLKYFGNKVPHAFIFGKKGDEIIGATIITNPHVKPRRGKVPVKTLFIGPSGEPKEESPDLTDHRLLVATENRATFAEQIMQTIPALSWKWSQFLLQGFDPVDAQALADAAKKVRIPIVLRHVRFPVFNFDKARHDGFAGVYEGLPTNKSRIKKNREKLQKNLGEIWGEWADTGEKAQEIFRQLVALNRNRWNQLRHEPGFFATDAIVSYYSDLIERLLPQGKASVYRLQAGEVTLGAILSFMDVDNVVIGFTSGINLTQEVVMGTKHERLATYTPGLLTHTAYMQECFERGYSQYDFGWGREGYKSDLANATDELVFAFSYKGLTGHAVDVARRIFYFYRDNPDIEDKAIDVEEALGKFAAHPYNLRAGRRVIEQALDLGKEMAKHTYDTSPPLRASRKLVHRIRRT